MGDKKRMFTIIKYDKDNRNQPIMTRYYNRDYDLMMSIRKFAESDNKMISQNENQNAVGENPNSNNIEEEIKEIRKLGL